MDARRLARLRDQLANALPGTTVPAAEVARVLEAALEGDGPRAGEEHPPRVAEVTTWRERLWTVPEETMLGITELCEALDRSRDWCYRACSAKRERPIPHAKLDGMSVFRAGQVRTWIEAELEDDHDVLRLDRRRKAS